MSKNPNQNITEAEFNTISSHADLLNILREKEVDVSDVLAKIHYEKEKEKLQVELVKLQQWV